MDIKDIVTTSTEEESTRNKNSNAGTSEKITSKLLVYEKGTFDYKDITHVPSLFKVIDELIVNVVDHFICCINRTTIQHKLKCDKQDRLMTTFKVCIDGESISVINTGYGIPVVQGEDGKYLPEILFSSQRTGTNMKSDKYRITGGTNGIGATIVMAFSADVTLQVADYKNKYMQKCIRNYNLRNNVDKFGKMEYCEPVITKNDKPDLQYTKVTFTIDWTNTKYKQFSKGVKSLFTSYINKRLIQSSIYMNCMAESIGISRPLVKLQDAKCNTCISDIAGIFGLSNYVHFTVEPAASLDKGYNNPKLLDFHIVLGVGTKYMEMSIINGVEVTKNPFIAHIVELLFKHVSKYCASRNIKVTKRAIKKYITIVFVGSVMNPQWVGQTKESLTINKKLLQKYNFDAAISDKIGDIVQHIFEHIVGAELKKSGDLKDVELKKYEPSINIIDRCKSASSLFLCEGDSARNLIRSIIGKDGKYSKQNSGILDLRGVIMNTFHRIVRQNVDEFKFAKINNGKYSSKLLFDNKSANNEFIKCLRKVANLDSRETYDDIVTSPYSEFIIATDPDLDGYNICGLMIVLMSKWPGIIRNRKLKLLQLPVIKVIPNSGFNPDKKYWEFFTSAEFEEWELEHKIPKGYKVKYYKGLATFEQSSCKIIAKNIDKYIYTFAWDNRANRNLEIFYGKDTEDEEGNILHMSDERKIVLRTPVRQMNEKEKSLYAKKIIPITTFLEIYVKSYMLDNVHRKLPKLMDGQNNVTGKLIYMYGRMFNSDNSEIKVANIGSTVSEKMNYHHGESSISRSVIITGQSLFGKKLYPAILGIGMWGHCSDGGKKSAGAPRYIYGKHNRNLYFALYRPEDDICLEYQYEEGHRIEPKFMLAILPIVILENYMTTAHGWKIENWGRNLKTVIKKVVTLINGNCINDDHIGVSSRNGKVEYLVNMTERSQHTMTERSQHAMTERSQHANIMTERSQHANIMTERSQHANIMTERSQHANIMTERSHTTCYSVAEYKIIGNKVFITRLPIGVWYLNYCDWIQSRIDGDVEQMKKLHGDNYEQYLHLTLGAIVDVAIDRSQDDNVNIEIRLHEKWKDALDKYIKNRNYVDEEHYEPIELVLGLRNRLNQDLNFIDPNNYVVSYDNYNDVIRDWYKHRLHYYELRISRQIVILRMRLCMLKNKKLYIEKFHGLGTRGKAKSELNKILSDAEFQRINLDVCINPDNFIETADLYDCMFVEESGVNEKYDFYVYREYIKGYASYEYLLSTKTGEINKSRLQKLQTEIADIENEIAELQSPGVIQVKWKQEIREFISAYEEYIGGL